MNISKLRLKVGDAVEVWPLSWSSAEDKKYQAIVNGLRTNQHDGAILLTLYDGKCLHNVESDTWGWGIRKLTEAETAVLLVHWT
jgi:hypothetical protein